MANMKTILLISGGVVAAFGAIIVMNIAASNTDAENFGGGVSQQTLPRQLPESNADPFQVISDEDEAARRATSNRNIADETIKGSGGALQSYTAPPVIQMEGSSGDAQDPMAGAFVNDAAPVPEALAETAIEPVRAPEIEYKVPETTVTESAPVTGATGGDPLTDNLLRRALLNGSRQQGISINSYNHDGGNGRVPMTIMEFQEGRDGGSAGGLPVTRLPDAAPSMAPTAPATGNGASRAPIMTLPETTRSDTGAAGGNRSGVLRTIDPNTPSSYIEGSLLDAALGYDRFAAVTSEHDADYDWRKPYQVAQVAIDNNSRIYDTARNAQSFDVGTLLLPGDQRYATLMYGFNSDDAAQLPVFAQLHDYGPASSAYLNGARVQGTLRLSNESAVMEFDRLILQDGRVIPITAMGISADQLRVGVFNNVNRHTLSRYSSLLVSGLIQGVGEVGQRVVDNRFGGNDGNVIIIGDGSTTDSSRDKFTDDDWAVIGMGAMRPIGDAMASNAARGFNRKPTVTAPAGFGFSIVFLEGLPFAQVQ